ncbi:hypothetical protein C8J57DRAFT_1291312 [Mycena rebaudengoi]|nr:hypothetical protein C8J57DRAFT_1291312 [Mycena rebaudengoi]
MSPLTFAFYCSGHGYGHATRVSALTSHLLCLSELEKPAVHVVSSAPIHVFTDSIALGAVYRYANIDPVIVQPLAYRVDRQQSVAVLKSFLKAKDAILETERHWLSAIGADCVLSDSAFIGCLAAAAVGIPSILVTNFTFDSVYSYLSTPLLDAPVSAHLDSERIGICSPVIPDIPVPAAELAPLVEQLHSGYRCADLLLRLPGHIPIPAFSIQPSLPSAEWVDTLTNKFRCDIISLLDQPPSSNPIYPSICQPSKPPLRQVVPVPLLVRSHSPAIYSSTGRSQLLRSIGVPPDLHDPSSTKILVVSFGGQVFRRPDRSCVENPSRNPSRKKCSGLPRLCIPEPAQSTQPLATSSHLWVPGAPPSSKPHSAISPRSPRGPEFANITPSLNISTPHADHPHSEPIDSTPDTDYPGLPRLLPDASWIAIVCGVSKEQWNTQADADLPDGFFVAPKDVYMPDLTAVGDVLLGKLGYDTVSECVDTCTPFVYVSRPLFIEEHGLRRLLACDGVGRELSRESYEAGDWAPAIEAAWHEGRAMKAKIRRDGGPDVKKREGEGRDMAAMIIRWVEAWRCQR